MQGHLHRSLAHRHDGCDLPVAEPEDLLHDYDDLLARLQAGQQATGRLSDVQLLVAGAFRRFAGGSVRMRRVRRTAGRVDPEVGERSQHVRPRVVYLVPVEREAAERLQHGVVNQVLRVEGVAGQLQGEAEEIRPQRLDARRELLPCAVERGIGP